jgi:hypothetical protein
MTIEEHRKKIEEMRAAEARVRAWLKDARHCFSIDGDIALLLERIDAYEASIAWHTDCLTCPKLLDENHHYFELLRRAQNEPMTLALRDAIAEALK